MTDLRFVMPVTIARGKVSATTGGGVGEGASVALGAEEDGGRLAAGDAPVDGASVVVQAASRRIAAMAAAAREIRIGADGSGYPRAMPVSRNPPRMEE
jgi:hypothetical protein